MMGITISFSNGWKGFFIAWAIVSAYARLLPVEVEGWYTVAVYLITLLFLMWVEYDNKHLPSKGLARSILFWCQFLLFIPLEFMGLLVTVGYITGI